jgi:site-specific recombinase XerD
MSKYDYSVRDFILAFRNHLGSPNTRRQYLRDVKDFLSWMERVKGSSTPKVCRGIGFKDLEAYLTDRTGRGAGICALDRARSAIRAFFGHLGRLGVVAVNPVDKLQSMKRPKSSRTTPTVGEVNDVLDHVRDSHPFWPSRDQAICELCYEGLTESDLIALDVADIDWSEGTVRRLSDRQRIPIGPLACQSLKVWVDERAARLQQKELGPDHTPALFIGFSLKRRKNPEFQGRIDPRTVCHVIQRIRPGWNASLLRDACGVHMLDEGATDRVVATQLGIGVGAVDRLLKMATRERGETVMKTHPRATLPACDEALEGDQISFPPSFFDPQCSSEE